MVPMRDSVCLATSVYLPEDTAYSPVPVVLVRTPYGRGYGGAFADSLLAHGIGFVSQDTRGRGGSEGGDSLFFNDGWGTRRDGYDTVEWLAAQEWCNGKIGYYGGSAYGITGYLCAGANPPHLVCGFVACSAADLYQHAAFPSGCYRKEQVDTWFSTMGLGHLLNQMVENYIYNEFWDMVNIFTRLDSITVPFYHIGGWYDTFCEGTVDAFCKIQANGGEGALGNQKMLIGPWCHGRWRNRDQGDLIYPENSLWQPEPLALMWFDHYLKDVDNGIQDTSPVRVYIMGEPTDTVDGCYWQEFSQWPPEESIKDSLFLHYDQSLSANPDTIDTFLTYFHDPGSPMLHNGGRNLYWLVGPKNQFFQDISPHGVIFTSEVLTEPVKLVGRVKAKIFVSSDCVDTDFMVRLVDVYPSGTAYLVFDGALCARFRQGTDHEVFMTPGEIYEMEIDLGNIAISFQSGHRIRVGISSALTSRYEVNPNTGEPFRQNTYTQIAHNNIHIGPSYPSRIVFDLLPDSTDGISENTFKPQSPEIKLYPNPFNSSIAITAPAGAEIEIYDLRGNVVYKPSSFQNSWVGRSNDNRSGVSAIIWKPESNIPAGIYWVRVNTVSSTLEKKIIYIK
ncbi:hypothetical protein DRQ33_04110 [bacterium]|nr:MAG: hypothetical protein DRQ33_04110 [bacterium]